MSPCWLAISLPRIKTFVLCSLFKTDVTSDDMLTWGANFLTNHCFKNAQTLF